MDYASWYYIGVVLAVRVAFFLYGRSYQGIVRHTSVEDVRSLLLSTTGSTATIVAISFTLWQIQDDFRFYIPLSILLIDYFCCLVFLVLSRFIVKTLYWGIISQRSDLKKGVLIYGAGITGLTTRNALIGEEGNEYAVLAFIDDDPGKIQKVIQGVKVISQQEAFEKYIKGQAEKPEVILAFDSINKQRLNKITEIFLKHDVSVKTVPSVNQWITRQLKPAQIRNLQIEDLLEREPIRLNNAEIRKQLAGQNVMVTGAAGSIGSELVRQILHHGPGRLILLDQAESALYDLEFNLRTKFAELVAQTELVIRVADITDQTRMEHIFEFIAPDYIFHAAAYKHVPLMEEHPYEAVRTNVVGTRIIADLALRYGTQKFVMISTDKAVNPTNVMGASKRLAEMYVQSLNHRYSRYHTRFIATRFGNVLGSNGSVVKVFEEQIKMGGPVTVTHPDIIRYFMTIPEACQLVLEAGAMGNGGEVFLFDMGEPVKIMDLARKMIRLSGYSADRGDIQIEFTGLRPGEKLYEELLNDNEKTMPTHHPKIMIAKVMDYKLDELQEGINTLHALLHYKDYTKLVNCLKQMVPEYISQNSVYELLDKKKIPVEVAIKLPL
ncbi:polysaccharide biosynthesis protein [Tellurirhabdus bombi]|uniref:polysaccharide biosynthesis protein n=1 Tax=Tellurirhabdus bombi TaxID=2907205 RepID=UPI001F31CB5F|nr:nucleoside-diphosphate sugar epimerase/dehydratase [Tellurirhabdus bombi]